jgi:hypothetical protein
VISTLNTSEALEILGRGKEGERDGEGKGEYRLERKR